MASQCGAARDRVSTSDSLPRPSTGFDYAYVDHPTLGGTSHFGLGLAFNFNPSQIRIEKVEAHDIYTSLYKRYAREPFGTLRVRNLDDQPIEAQLSVFVPRLMTTPST